MEADVVPDTQMRGVAVTTPQARVEASQSHFTLREDSKATWLDVMDGQQVLLTYLAGDDSIEVAAGRFGVAGDGYACRTYPLGVRYVDGPVIYQDDFEYDTDKFRKNWTPTIRIPDLSSGGPPKHAGRAVIQNLAYWGGATLEDIERDGKATKVVRVDARRINSRKNLTEIFGGREKIRNVPDAYRYKRLYLYLGLNEWDPPNSYSVEYDMCPVKGVTALAFSGRTVVLEAMEWVRVRTESFTIEGDDGTRVKYFGKWIEGTPMVKTSRPVTEPDGEKDEETSGAAPAAGLRIAGQQGGVVLYDNVVIRELVKRKGMLGKEEER
jgi:hypothetical protein